MEIIMLIAHQVPDMRQDFGEFSAFIFACKRVIMESKLLKNCFCMLDGQKNFE